jgi:hypothetical protein
MCCIWLAMFGVFLIEGSLDGYVCFNSICGFCIRELIFYTCRSLFNASIRATFVKVEVSSIRGDMILYRMSFGHYLQHESKSVVRTCPATSLTISVSRWLFLPPPTPPSVPAPAR